MHRHLTTSALALAAVVAGAAAHADCGIEAGSVRILSNDFPALRAVSERALECASGTVTVTANATAEHANIQVPSMTVTPAEYTVKTVANDSIVPLLADGLIRPLDDLVAEYGQDLDPGQLIKINGQTMAIAFMANAQHLAYRRDILDQAGIAEAPASYEEVLAAAEAIRAAGIMENPLGANNKPGWDLAEEFVNMYMGTGAEFFEAGTATLALDHDKAVQALEMMKALTAYMPADYMTYESTTLSELYAQGQIAMVNMWGSRTGTFLDPAQATSEVAENTVLTRAPTVGGGTIPATTVWWDGFAIAQNISDADAEASFRAMLHGIDAALATGNPDLAAWLIPGYEPTPAVVGVIETAQAGAKPYPMAPWMGTLHAALGAELSDFMQGTENAEAALSGVTAAYEAAARSQGFLQ